MVAGEIGDLISWYRLNLQANNNQIVKARLAADTCYDKQHIFSNGRVSHVSIAFLETPAVIRAAMTMFS